jgi:glycosyltransferase involved in cell wall biosynthesis
MRLSIITINYNNVVGLRQTIESVISQKCQDFEYIVIDGGSTDGSVDVIKKYANKIDYWVSEPDSGIYNAMNKGTRVAHGDYCQYLNSGDWLFDENVVDKILPHLDGSADIILGRQWNAMLDKKFKRERLFPNKLSFAYFISYTLPHQSTFIRRSSLLNRPYREDFKIVSDWIFLFELYLFENVTYKRVNINTAYFDRTGISSNSINDVLIERMNFLKTIDSERFVSDYALIPTDIYDTFRDLKYAFKFKKVLTMLIQATAWSYLLIKRHLST